MQILKRNSFLFLFVLISGCASSTFRIDRFDDHRVELKVTSDRVFLTCADPESENHTRLFIMYVLDEKNTVMEVIGNLMHKDSCFDQLGAVDKIIKKSLTVTIYGMGSINQPRVVEKEIFMHPELGSFHTNGHTLGFSYIANETGACYGAHTGTTKPCPQSPFPIKAYP